MLTIFKIYFKIGIVSCILKSHPTFLNYDYFSDQGITKFLGSIFETQTFNNWSFVSGRKVHVKEFDPLHPVEFHRRRQNESSRRDERFHSFCNNNPVAAKSKRLHSRLWGTIRDRFHQHFTSSYYAKILKAQKDSDDLTVFFRFWDLRSYKMHVSMFVKMTPGSRFTTLLNANS